MSARSRTGALSAPGCGLYAASRRFAAGAAVDRHPARWLRREQRGVVAEEVIGVEPLEAGSSTGEVFAVHEHRRAAGTPKHPSNDAWAKLASTPGMPFNSPGVRHWSPVGACRWAGMRLQEVPPA